MPCNEMNIGALPVTRLNLNGTRRNVHGCSPLRNTSRPCARYAACRVIFAMTLAGRRRCMRRPKSVGPRYTGRWPSKSCVMLIRRPFGMMR
nr:MAG TPA: hypothetical protein [Caudoviricetes sp.]